ncbi:hypothetical protein RA279_28190, partial [Pseudomonas syringae pv. tagetis]|uniref:hypothetical protein n=1 Tax=Pseudomonas syringae group genomosp. 7 TaxID=251699 RepID=UPI0037704F8B
WGGLGVVGWGVLWCGWGGGCCAGCVGGCGCVCWVCVCLWGWCCVGLGWFWCWCVGDFVVWLCLLLVFLCCLGCLLLGVVRVLWVWGRGWRF